MAGARSRRRNEESSMKNLKPYLNPVVNRRRAWKIWRALAFCWGVACLLAALVLALPDGGAFLPFEPVGLLFTLLMGGTVLTVFLQREKPECDYRRVVREIERDHPELGAALLTAIEQRPDPETGRFHFLQERVLEKAVAAFVQTGFANAYPAKRLRSLQFGSTCVLLLAICLSAATFLPRVRSVTLSADSSRQEVEAGEATVARLAKVEPGDVEVELGAPLSVLAHFEEASPEVVSLVATFRSGETRRLSMTKNLRDPVFGYTFPSVFEPFRYHVEYDGRESEVHQVTVYELPALERADATMAYPDYAGLSDKTVEDVRRLSLPEGARLSYVFHLNKPVAAATLVGEKEEAVELRTFPDDAKVELPSILLTQTRKWKLELMDEAGRRNKFTPRIEISVLPNKPPTVKILAPGGDRQVSPLEEVAFAAEVEDDFGLRRAGFAYNLDGGEVREVELTGEGGGAEPMGLKTEVVHALALEGMEVVPGQLVSWYFWAEDSGPDGKPRRTYGDMFFAEVRPFEEIFRKGPEGGEQQQQQQGKKPGEEVEKLIKLQKQIINATWKMRRRSLNLDKDVPVLLESQYKAMEQVSDLLDIVETEKGEKFLQQASDHMEKAVYHLSQASLEASELVLALSAEQGAYQALLNLLAHEFQVSRSKSSSSQAAQSSRNQRSQSQLDQLDLSKEEDRYETESQARRLQEPEQREQLQELNRLRELAQRQQDLNERLKEAEYALRASETPEKRAEIERQLKRLRDEQRRNLNDLDELKQRMERPENRSRTAEERRLLDKTRSEMTKAAEQLREGKLSEAVASGTRAEKDLKEIRDELREKTSVQFAEDMRELRRDARELSQRQREIGQELAEEAKAKPRSLSDDEGDAGNELAEAFDQQKAALNDLLQDVKDVVEKSELVEPLLNRKLYKTFRQAHRDQTEKSLAAASTLLRDEADALRDYSFRSELEEVLEGGDDPETLVDHLRRGEFKKAGKALGERSQLELDDLKQGVEKAAESVLGSETEALKFAEHELAALENALQWGLAEGKGESENREGKAAGEEGKPSKPGEGETEQFGDGRNPDEPGAQENAGKQNDKAGESEESSGEDQSSSGKAGQPGSSDLSEQGARSSDASGSPSEKSPDGEMSSVQSGPSGSLDKSSPSDSSDPSGKHSESTQPREPGQPNQTDRPNEQITFLNQGAASETGVGNPVTGEDVREWTERLRDVEEAVDLPEVRESVSRIREDLRKMNREFKRHSKEPEWRLVQKNLLGPLNEVRKRLAEELAKHRPDDSLTPIDRDPVPDEFDELVRRYYLRLGKGEEE